MSLININLLAQQQTRVSRLGQANFVVAVVAGVLVGLQLLIVVFLYSTIGIRSAEKKNAINKQQEYQGKISDLDKQSDNPAYPSMTLKQQATAYQSQVDALGQLIDNHRYFSLYISEIAQNTPPQILYTSFASDATDQLTILGQATTYGEVAKLAENFKNLSFAKGAAIQEAKLSKAAPSSCAGNPRQSDCFPIRFTLLIQLKSAAELNKLPGPIPKTGQTAPPQAGSSFLGGSSPRPSATPTASSGGKP